MSNPLPLAQTAGPRRRQSMFILDFIVSHPVLLASAVVVIIVVANAIRVANQYERAVVFRLGKYNRTSGPGLYLVWPIVEWQTRLDLRTITTDVEQQEGITRDNVPIKVNAVIWLRIVLGQHTLDDILKAQDTIANAMQRSIDNVTEPWGVKVERVQMKNVEIPPTMQRAMAQEAEALREK